MSDITTVHETPPEAQVMFEAATLAARRMKPEPIDPALIYTAPDDEGVHHAFSLEKFLPAPHRKRDNAKFFTASSLIEYVNRHKIDGATTLWANIETSTIGTVIDDHDPESPGWADHVAHLELRHPPEWVRWNAASGRLMDQTAFAEHIEIGVPDVLEPDGADLLEIAQSFHANGKVIFKSDRRLADGNVQFTYEQTLEARAGERGDLTIPQTFLLGLSPYEGVAPFRVVARLRYRVREGVLQIGYTLERPEDVLRASFNEMADQISVATGIDVWSGVPSTERG